MQTETGLIYNGVISGTVSFGAFVRLENGESGMVHISEISSSYVENINDAVKVGDSVRVLVTNIAPDGKIALSIKKAEEKEAPAPQTKAPRQKQPSKTRSYASRLECEGPKDFEDMMADFLRFSNDKQTDAKRSSDFRSKSKKR